MTATAFKKSDIIDNIALKTDLAKQKVNEVLNALDEIIQLHLSNNGPGEFTLNGLFKLLVKTQDAKPEREGVNPFTQKKIIIPAKPAHKVVRVKILKKLKDFVE